VGAFDLVFRFISLYSWILYPGFFLLFVSFLRRVSFREPSPAAGPPARGPQRATPCDCVDMMPNIFIDLTEPISSRADLIDLTSPASDGSEAGNHAPNRNRTVSRQSTPKGAPKWGPSAQLQQASPRAQAQLSQSPAFAPRETIVHAPVPSTVKLSDDGTGLGHVKSQSTSPVRSRTPPLRSIDTAPSTNNVNGTTPNPPRPDEGAESSGMKSRPSASHATLPLRSSPAGPLATQSTPKGVTPRKTEWTVEKIAERLRHLTKDLDYQHRVMTYRVLQANKRQVQERRQLKGDDLFADVKIDSAPEEKGLAVRAKFKVRRRTRQDDAIPRKSYPCDSGYELLLTVLSCQSSIRPILGSRIHPWASGT